MQFKEQPRDLDTPLEGDSHGEMWATPRRLSVVTVKEGWWFPEPSQSFSPWALALCSWPCKGPWQLTLPHVSGEGGFGIVNLSNVELHWTSLQKLVCLVNGRKNFTPDNRTDQKSKRGHLFRQGLSVYFCDWIIDSFPSFSERISDFFNLTSGSCDTLKPALPPHSTPWFHSQVDVFCQNAPSLCSSWEETK